MNRLDTKTRARIVACLVEGSSVRATCRMTGAAKGTVLKLLADLGAACSEVIALIPEPVVAPWGSRKRRPLGETAAES